MRKIYLLLIILTLVLCGCSNQTNNENVTEVKDPEVVGEVETTVNVTVTDTPSPKDDLGYLDTSTTLDTLTTLPIALSNGDAKYMARYSTMSSEDVGWLVNQTATLSIIRTLYLDESGNPFRFFSEVLVEHLSDENVEAISNLSSAEIAEYIANMYTEYSKTSGEETVYTAEQFAGLDFTVTKDATGSTVLISSRFMPVHYLSDVTDNKHTVVYETDYAHYLQDEAGTVKEYFKDDVSIKTAVIDSYADKWSEPVISDIDELFAKIGQ